MEAVNDAPAITVPQRLDAKEEVPVTVSGVRVEDPDCDDIPRGALELTIMASYGTLEFRGSLAGLYLMQASPQTLKVRGKVNPINAALAGLAYTGVSEFSGADTIIITADDLGNSGEGETLQAIRSIPVVVSSVNDPPQLWVPEELIRPAGGALFVLEDERVSLGQFGVSDPDDEFVRVKISARVGTIGIDEFKGQSIRVEMRGQEHGGDGTRGSSAMFEGTTEEVSEALENMSYISALDWNSVAHDRDLVEVRRLLAVEREDKLWARHFVRAKKCSTFIGHA